MWYGVPRMGEFACDRGLLDTWDPINASLLAVLVDAPHECRDAGKGGGVRNRAAVCVKASLPAGVDVDVLEAVRLQSGSSERIGLCLDICLSEKVAIDGLLAECAPAEIGPLAYTIDLCDRLSCTWEQTTN